MRLIFIIIAVFGILYFLSSKRRFDFFSIAFFSACAYFIPGFFGYCLYPSMQGTTETVVFEQVELADEVYLIMTTVLIGIFVVSIVFDKIIREHEPKAVLKGSGNTALIATYFAVAGFLISAITTGKALFYTDKMAMLGLLNRWYIIWVVCASLGAVIAFTHSKWNLFCICMILIFLDVFIGNRMSFAMTIIAIFTIHLAKKGNTRFFTSCKKEGIVGVICILFIFAYKFIYFFVKAGEWEAVSERIGNIKFYLNTISQSEPFITQSILNKVVENRFNVEFKHFGGVIQQLILFAPNFGGEDTSFNTLFQEQLFPGLNFGMANNIWAEMWSSGGWPLLLLFIMLFTIVLFIGAYLLRVKDPALKGGGALFMSFWAFYIHRNDLMYQINLQKRVLLFLLACLFFSMLIYEIGSGKSKLKGNNDVQIE